MNAPATIYRRYPGQFLAVIDILCFALIMLIKTTTFGFKLCVPLIFSFISIGSLGNVDKPYEQVTYVFDGEDCLDNFGRPKELIAKIENTDEKAKLITLLGMLTHVHYMRAEGIRSNFTLMQKVCDINTHWVSPADFQGHIDYVNKHVEVVHIPDMTVSGRMTVRGILSSDVVFTPDLSKGLTKSTVEKVLHLISPEDLRKNPRPSTNTVTFTPKGMTYITGRMISIELLEPNKTFVRKGHRPDNLFAHSTCRYHKQGKGILLGKIQAGANLRARMYYTLSLPEALSSEPCKEADLALFLELSNKEAIPLSADSVKIVFRNRRFYKNKAQQLSPERTKDYILLPSKDSIHIEQKIGGSLPPQKSRHYQIKSACIKPSRAHDFFLKNGVFKYQGRYIFKNETGIDLPYGSVLAREGYDGHLLAGDIFNSVRQNDYGVILPKLVDNDVTVSSTLTSAHEMHLVLKNKKTSKEVIFLHLPTPFTQGNQSSAEIEGGLWLMRFDMEPQSERCITLRPHPMETDL